MRKPAPAIPLAIVLTLVLALVSNTIAVRADLPKIPSSLEIAVSYADTEGRPGAGMCDNCFPSPWCGSFGVQFVGSSTNYNGNSSDPSNCGGGAWDTGGILVTNKGATAVTLTNLTVALPLPASGDRGSPSCSQPPRPVVFNLWFGQKYYFGNLSAPAYFGGPVIVPPGGEAIFAGTSSDGSYTCPTGNYPSSPPHATYDFDTSDADFFGGCTPTTDTVSDPQITFSAVGYMPTTYIDEGHVIDTGGIDPGNCAPTAVDPQWGHEFLGWRLASSTCGEYCPTNQLGLAAATVAVPSSAYSAARSIGAGGVSPTLAYEIGAVATVLVIVLVYLVSRAGKRTP